MEVRNNKMQPFAQQILEKEQTRRIPVTSLMRMWSLGNSHAKIAAYYLSYILRSSLLDSDAKQKARNQVKLKSALQLLGTMGYLRGAVMKMGQLLANLPQIVGPEMVEIFESLHFEAPPMHYSLIREVFLDELGKEPEELFLFFDRTAFAAASLGQVHRARLHDGTEVAVKIQYPDIGRTIQADFKTLGTLLQAMRFKDDFQNLTAHVIDARDVFLKEVDYLNEASYMEENRKVFSGTDIVVPQYFPTLSTRKVLTMEYLPGQHLRDFLEQNPTQDQRNHFGELISYSLIRSFFTFRTIYADLHPGNYIFMDDGRLGFIDFGCFRRFSVERWQFEMESEEAMLQGDKDGILRFLTGVARCNRKEELDPDWAEMSLRQVDWVVRPIATKGSFDFADEAFVQEGVELFREMFSHGSYGRMDCFYNWTNRALLGHRGLLFRLKSKFDYRSMYLQEMHRAMS